MANLITNAIKYTLPEGQVTVILKQQERFALILIQDTGIGIAPAQQNHIFERFYRVDSGRSWQTGGTGLGLTIAQAIAVKHQGKIRVKSKLGFGSEFILSLPLFS